MVVIRDYITGAKLRGIKLIAGNKGLDREISRISILEWEHIQSGAIMEDLRHLKELVLVSIPSSVGQEDDVLNSVKTLVQMRTSGVVLRSRQRELITASVIAHANHCNYPLFIMDDSSSSLEEMIIHFHAYKEQEAAKAHQIKALSNILYGRLDPNAIQNAMQEINYYFSSPYCVYYLKPIQGIGKSNLNSLLRRGLSRELHCKGNALIPYRDGAFFVHSLEEEPSAQDVNTAWSRTLGLDFSRFHVGFSDTKDEMRGFRNALMESFYACFCVEKCNSGYSGFSDLGVYRVLYYSMDFRWVNDYLKKTIDLILDHDKKNKCDFWDTLAAFERNNGSYRETAKETFSHENTVRNRLNRMVEIMNKDARDYSFQEELLIAVKLFYVRDFIHNNKDLFPL